MKRSMVLCSLLFATSTILFLQTQSFAVNESPNIYRETFEWTNLWVDQATRTDLPRVLLFGDSVCNGYYDNVKNELNDKILTAKLATSSSLGDPMLLDQLRLMLKNYKFDVIHFNNGLHGASYTDEEFRNSYTQALAIIKELAPEAKLILVTSTPYHKAAPNLHELDPEGNQQVKNRNNIVMELAAKNKIPVNDLYSLVLDHPEYSSDALHYNPKGRAVQAKQVAEKVLKAIGQ